ncbi:MAG TPA: hypothetical protein VFV31_07075 [Chitinophagaceae bacterium]|nr:hypothetical protein [Chitinophagaceae bacterium]
MRKAISITAIAGIFLLMFILLTSGDIKSRYDGGSKDLVDELYFQAVKQNNNLEAIEEDIEKFYKKKSEAMEKYNSFTAYNSRYYSDARANANAISDSLTRKKAVDIIFKGESRYQSKLAGWQSIITSLNKNEKELNELHNLLKILVTEPMMEKYQQNNLPERSKALEANDELQKVIQKIKAITL